MALRQAVVISSQNLARSFGQTANSIEDARNGIDAKLNGDLDLINTAASSLADLNARIQNAHALGGKANDLEDQRRTAADTLSRLTGGSTYTNEQGDLMFALPGGTALVSGASAGRMSAVPDPANAGHFKVRVAKSDGSLAGDVPVSSLGGEVGGLLDARDGTLKTALNQIDGFAFDLATAMNTIHSAGYAMDGTTGRPLFTIPVSSSGAASQITVNAAISADATLLAAATTLPSATGDNRNILAMMTTETQVLAGGNNPVATLQKITGDFGASASRAQAMSQHDSAMVNHINQLRESTAGVSLDEEMINLTKAQKAYEAVSKVIGTADQMLDTLLKLR